MNPAPDRQSRLAHKRTIARDPYLKGLHMRLKVDLNSMAKVITNNRNKRGNQGKEPSVWGPEIKIERVALFDLGL